MTTLLVDLRAEAAAEVRRVSSARAFVREGDDRALEQLEADGPWITRARRPALRRFLGGQLMLIWRVAYEDARGGRTESRLIAVLIELSAAPVAPRRRSWISAWLRDVDSDVRARIDADGREWQETVERVVRSFASARISREHGIAVSLARTDRMAFQPGLFDRRAEQAQRLHVAASAESDRITADRLATSEQFTAVARRPAELLLVLIP